MSEGLGNDSRRVIIASVVIVLGFAIAINAPLWRSYWFPSHEMGRYLLRTFEFVRGWKDGHLIPRWAPDFYGGYGAPTFVLFSPGVLAIGGFPSLFGIELATSMKLMIALYGAIGSIGMFYLVRGETRRADAAVVAAVAFTFVPYRFVDLYIRGDLAEYGALCLLPLVLWLYRELGRTPSEKLWRFGCAAAAAHAFMIISHTIIGQWATELVFIVLVVTLARLWRVDRSRVMVGMVAFAGALGLAAFYLVPALSETRYLQVKSLISSYFDPAKHAVPFRSFFNFSYYAFVGDETTETPNAIRMPFTIGIPLAAAMVAALLSLISPRRRTVLRAALPWWILTVALLVLMSPLSTSVWKVLPFGTKIQFPWRLLALVAAVGSAAVGTTWAAVIPSLRWRWVLAATAITLIAWDGHNFVRIGDATYPTLPAGVPGMTAKSIYTRMQGMGAGEDLPRSVSKMPDRPRTKLVQTVSGVAQASAVQLDGTRYRVTIDAAERSTVELSVFYYPGWHVTLESGPAKIARSMSATGLIQLQAPGAGHYEALVEFHNTLPRTTGAIISLLSLFGLYPCLRVVLRRQIAHTT